MKETCFGKERNMDCKTSGFPNINPSEDWHHFPHHWQLDNQGSHHWPILVRWPGPICLLTRSPCVDSKMLINIPRSVPGLALWFPGCFWLGPPNGKNVEILGSAVVGAVQQGCHAATLSHPARNGRKQLDSIIWPSFNYQQVYWV